MRARKPSSRRVASHSPCTAFRRASPICKDERKGPQVGAPDAAVQGFLKAAGLTSLEEAKIQRDPKKGDFYVALIERQSRAVRSRCWRNSCP